MRVALDISSTHDGNQFRGIGFYSKRLHQELVCFVQEDKEFRLKPFDGTSVPRPSRSEVDLFHFPAFSPFFFSFPFHLVSKSVITIHDLIPLEFADKFPAGFRGQLRWQIQRLVLPFCRHIITDSIASKKTIRKISEITDEKISVVYLAADPSLCKINNKASLQEIREKYHLPPHFVLYVGDLNWHKNVVNLAKACLKLGYPLVVVGKQAVAQKVDLMHPWNTELIQFQLLAQDKPNQIIRLGFVPTQDLGILYNLARCLAHPVHAEGFGLTVLEAMQCGCPVLTSSSSSLPEITGDAAILINPKSPYELETQLTRIWRNKPLRQQLSKQGIERAKLFSWEKTAKETVEVYNRVLK